jgi:hypothetical protein
MRVCVVVVVVPKMPSFQTSLRYSDLGRGIVRGVQVGEVELELELELELRCGTDAVRWKRR